VVVDGALAVFVRGVAGARDVAGVVPAVHLPSQTLFVADLVALPPPSPPLSDGGADVVLLPPPEPEDASEAEGPPAAEPERRERQKVQYKKGLDGAEIRYMVYPDKENPLKFYKNYRIKCTNPDHPTNCGKTRGRQFEQIHGEIEPIAFLHTWLLVHHPAAGAEHKSHAMLDPSPEDVTAMVRDRAPELRQVFEQW
jgi:hypothetical protein